MGCRHNAGRMGGGLMGESFGVAAFRSRQQVMRMNELYHREGLKTGVISTPHEISAGCGLSVRFELGDLAAVRRVTYRVRPEGLIGLYRVDLYPGRKPALTALNK